jgi:signal transduction histidine kinase
MAVLRALLADPDPAKAQQIAAAFALDREFELIVQATLPAALDELRGGDVNVVILSLDWPDMTASQALERARTVAPSMAAIVAIGDDPSLPAAEQAVDEGAQDYLSLRTGPAAAIVRAARLAVGRLRRSAAAAGRSEAELRQAQKMEAVGRLAGGVAHDFNNVLTAIFGYTDLLLDSLGPESAQHADIQEIRRAAQRAAGLTRQLLAFSRKQVMLPRRVNLNAVIANLQPLLARLIGEDIELAIDPDRGLDDIEADPGQLEQVLMNLAANARDAMPEGGRLSLATANDEIGRGDARLQLGLLPGAFVRLTVTDTGEGIPDAARPHIFEPFFTTKDQDKGTGLGLATVYGIVKQSGGWIYLDASAAPGTRFTIYLPRLASATAISFP